MRHCSWERMRERVLMRRMNWLQRSVVGLVAACVAAGGAPAVAADTAAGGGAAATRMEGPAVMKGPYAWQVPVAGERPALVNGSSDGAAFSFPAVGQNGPIVGSDNGLCIASLSTTPSSTSVQAQRCDQSALQTWTVDPNGSVRLAGQANYFIGIWVNDSAASTWLGGATTAHPLDLSRLSSLSVGALHVADGNNQTVSSGDSFAPLAAVARTVSGQPVPGASVAFQVQDDGDTGTVFRDANPDIVATTPDGVATTDRELVAGPRNGDVRVRATAGSALVEFVLHVGPVVAQRVVIAAGDDQSAEAGARYGTDLAARVETNTGLGVGNIPVTFTIRGNTGTRFDTTKTPNARLAADGTSVVVTSATNTNDPDQTGAATAPTMIAGPQAGPFTVEVEADGVTKTIDFSESVVPGNPTHLQVDSGDGQETAPYTPFGHNLRVKVTNSAGAAVQGAGVQFEIRGATGTTFADGTSTADRKTDENGLTGTPRIIAGDSGSVTVVATASNGAEVSFHLTVTGTTHLGKNPVTGQRR